MVTREQGSIGEPMSSNEVRKRTREVILEYAMKSNHILHPMVVAGEGRRSLGSVPGRPDDEQIQIDAMGENILANLVRDSRLPVLLLGEHIPHDFSGGNPKVILTVDAFDNSSEYSRGLDTPVYSVLGAYSNDGSPIGSAVVDIRGQKGYLSIKKENHLVDLSSDEELLLPRIDNYEKILPPRGKTSVKDDKLVIATYLGSNEYSTKFFDSFRNMIDDMPRKGRIYPNGGAFIYAYLATGAVDAYVMFDEPNSEILPGLPLALAAGCSAVSVDLDDGSISEYKFDPDFISNPSGYTHGTVDLFIASKTPELRNEIIKYYMEGKIIPHQENFAPSAK